MKRGALQCLRNRSALMAGHARDQNCSCAGHTSGRCITLASSVSTGLRETTCPPTPNGAPPFVVHDFASDDISSLNQWRRVFGFRSLSLDRRLRCSVVVIIQRTSSRVRAVLVFSSLLLVPRQGLAQEAASSSLP